MLNVLKRLAREEEGQDLIEYALLAAFISLAAVGAMQLVGSSIRGLFTTVSGKLDDASAAATAGAAGT